jgi:hypothetical protein
MMLAVEGLQEAMKKEELAAALQPLSCHFLTF